MRRSFVLAYVALLAGCSSSSSSTGAPAGDSGPTSNDASTDATNDASSSIDSSTLDAPSDGATQDSLVANDSGTSVDSSIDVGVPPPGIPPAAMPVISRGAPAYASSNAYGGNPATYANDGDYSRGFRSTGYPMWIAYDLSGVPVAQRGPVYVAWYNESFGYDNSTGSTTPASYNEPGDFTIEANAAAGGKLPAADDPGWTPLAKVNGNTVHSQSYLLALTGYSWVRFRATAGSATNANLNTDCEIKFDVHDAHLGLDAWVFIGDSITALAMGHAESGSTNFAEAIAAGDPGHFPAYESAGFPYLKAEGDGPGILAKVLPVSPAALVGLSFGTNDGAGSMATDFSFHDAYKQLVDTILSAGKIPVVPTIPYSNDPTHNANIGDPTDATHPYLLNVQLTTLKSEYRAAGKVVLDGPDLWSFFKANPTLIKPNDVHPTDGAGTNAYRNQWSAKALKIVYGK